MKNSKIPKLQKTATWSDIKNYLKWLGSTEKYAYHIDDDPMDIESFTSAEQKVLRSNSDIMWAYAEKHKKELWDFYDVLHLIEDGNYL
ncbi:MAG TPA: hypothetical protein VMX17_08205 [Candidatus Glassbacteria bacterium]|nr:hypothetical protein [Candidatus Glassbacteria bacterium]